MTIDHREALEAIWRILTYVGPTGQYEAYARDIAVQALGEEHVAALQTWNMKPHWVAQTLLGKDYPEDGWEDGIRGKERTY